MYRPGVPLQEPGLSVGSSTYKIESIAMAFEHAHQVLSNAIQQWNTCMLEPVSDGPLRDGAASNIELSMPRLRAPERARKLHILRDLPPPVPTLMLGVSGCLMLPGVRVVRRRSAQRRASADRGALP